VVGRRIEDLSSGFLSLFKGIKSRRISLFSPEDTEALVRLSEQNDSLKWSDEAVSKVKEVSGGHPFLTQQLCQVIWDNLYDNEPEQAPTVNAEDVEQAVPEALKTAENSLTWLYDGLGPAERVVASALAQAGPKAIAQEELEKILQESGVRILIGELQDAPRVLADWDLIQPEAEGYKFRVEMLRRWIAQKKPLSRVQEEIDRVLPVADNLFQAAYGIYQGGDLDGAVPLLQQAVKLNPNHLKGNHLLAEILLAQNKTDEALKILEMLYEYNPAAARPRLIQALLIKAKGEKEEENRLHFYEKILELDARQPEALSEYEKICLKRGDEAFRKFDIDNVVETLKKAFRFSPDAVQKIVRFVLDRAEKENDENRQLLLYEKVLEMDSQQSEVAKITKKIWEKKGDIAVKNEAFEEALDCYSKAEVPEKTARVQQRLHIENLYAQSVAMIAEKPEKAVELLKEVIAFDPRFKEAAKMLYRTVSREDIDANKKEMAKHIKGLTEQIRGLEKEKNIFQKQLNGIFQEHSATVGIIKKSSKKKLRINLFFCLCSIPIIIIIIKLLGFRISSDSDVTIIILFLTILTMLPVTIFLFFATLSKMQEQFLFRLNQDWRPITYVENKYNDNGDGTITDQSAGLTWEKSGSGMRTYKFAEAYIEKLNKEKFADRKNWRLPTVEELMSLLEEKKQSNGLYINPIFDKKQKWCWTADKRSFGGVWCVHFGYGKVIRSHAFTYVRAVCSE